MCFVINTILIQLRLKFKFCSMIGFHITGGRPLRAALFTREYPPNVYGGAGVHVEYLSRELAKKIEVEVYCWGDQKSDVGQLQVSGALPWSEISNGTSGKFKAALETLSLNLTQVKDLAGIDIVHTHTWYASMAGFWAKKLYDVPFVLTTHSLEPLRAWKAEQLGSGYAMSSWIERTAILDADAIIAVSQGTKEDIVRAYPEVKRERLHVIYNGIDLDEYRPTPETTALTTYGVDPKIPYVLFVGRITRQKGVTHLVDAIEYLPRDTQIVLCAGAPGYAGNRRRNAPESGGGPQTQRPYRLDRKNGHQARSHSAVQSRACVLLPFRLRALRHYQS